MQDLPKDIHQHDKALYQSITPEGSENYEMLYMSGRAQRDQNGHPQGIPADDFNVFATMVYAFDDHSLTFAARHDSGKTVRHIDVGTGPSLYPFIASLPYADELIAIDLTPANIQRLQAIANKATPVAPHWQAWLEIAAILYDIGSAQRLAEIDRSYPHLYDDLRHWPILDSDQKMRTRGTLRTLSDQSKLAANPYNTISLETELPAKLLPRVGDAIDDIAPLSDLSGTADIYTHVFYSESVDNTLEVVAHAETNGIQFAKPGALAVSAHMAKTDGYKGFFTPEQLAKDADLKLVEFPASPHFFETLIGELITVSNKYRILWHNLEHVSQDRKMVRQGLHYGGIVIMCGLASHKRAGGNNKYDSGLDLLRQLKPVLRTVAVHTSDNQKATTINCTVAELEEIIAYMTHSFILSSQHSTLLSITLPLLKPLYGWTLLPAEDFESDSVDNY